MELKVPWVALTWSMGAFDRAILIGSKHGRHVAEKSHRERFNTIRMQGKDGIINTCADRDDR